MSGLCGGSYFEGGVIVIYGFQTRSAGCIGQFLYFIDHMGAASGTVCLWDGPTHEQAIVVALELRDDFSASYIVDATRFDPGRSPKVAKCARWLTTQEWDNPSIAVEPLLRKRFDLTAFEVTQAIASAHLIRWLQCYD